MGCAILIFSSAAFADIGVILNESLNTGILARATSAGHSAIYFSRICPASPVKLRLCRPGEDGSVLSTYDHFGEDQAFEWNVVPLNIYLYGVENARDQPLFASPAIKRFLEERYRERFLFHYCDAARCDAVKNANWRDMVGATFDRSVYVFVVATTPEQDRAFIARFNTLPNRRRFNAIFRNCADFTKDIVNSFFPHSAHRDLLNDFGMTSPKAVAHSFSNYALRHPELNFRVLHFAQLPGTIKRSSSARDGTEQLYRSKEWVLPLAFFDSHELPAFALSYLLFGRFNPQRDFEQYPSVADTEAAFPIRQAELAGGSSRWEGLRSEEAMDRESAAGTPEAWNQYRSQFAGILEAASSQPGDAEELRHFFQDLARNSRPFADGNDLLWLEVPVSGTRSLGLTERNIFAPESDSHLALELLLARVNQELKSSPHSREDMDEFRRDWELLRLAESSVYRMDETGGRAEPASRGSEKIYSFRRR